MTLDSHLVSLLENDLRTKFGARLYPTTRPENAGLPVVLYFESGDGTRALATHNKPLSATRDVDYQFSVMAEQRTVARAIANWLQQRLVGHSDEIIQGALLATGTQETFEQALKAYRIIVEVQVWARRDTTNGGM